MVSRDWAEQHIHECIVGSSCGFCPALNLGLCAISLISARLDFPLMIPLLPLHGPYGTECAAHANRLGNSDLVVEKR
jgi:hypothetical protein